MQYTGIPSGIGTGACGPAIALEFLYDARRDYRLRFLIRSLRPANSNNERKDSPCANRKPGSGPARWRHP